MRTFLAIEIFPELRAEIEKLRDRLRRVDAHVKWVESHNTHLTLKFLGEIPEGSLEQAKQIIAAAAASAEPFELHIHGAGRFPPYSSNVRVLWVGAEDATGTLKRLHHQLDTAFTSLGVEREDKPFSGHITLGRLKQPRSAKQLIAAIDAAADVDIGMQPVKELVLFKSDLTPGGPVYSPLARIALGGGSETPACPGPQARKS